MTGRFVFFATCVVATLLTPVFQARVAGIRQPVFARHAMVIAQQPAEEAGLAVLRKGGNAVDAAIASGVFGSPYVVVDGEGFWGADRLWQVEEWLARGGW